MYPDLANLLRAAPPFFPELTMKRLFLPILGVVVVLASCRELPSDPFRGSETPTGNFALADASTLPGEFPGLYFLSPLVDNPEYSGDFAVLPTRIEICELEGGVPEVPDLTTGCVQVVETFEFSEISVDEIGEKYQVNWDTDGLDTEKNYRISVFVVDELVGFRDVHPVLTSQEVPNPQTQALYVFRVGSNIPIKFRLETGSLCSDDAVGGVCAVGAVFSGSSATVALFGEAGVEFPADALPAGVGAIAVVVEEVDLPAGVPCLGVDENGQFRPLDIPVDDTCFRIRTIPDGLTLAEVAIVGVCLDGTGSLTDIHSARIHKSDESAATQALQKTLTTICGTEVGFRDSDLPTNPLARLAVRGLRTIRSLVGPEPLRATHLGGGGMLRTFSRFAFAVPTAMSKAQGDDQITLVGTKVPVDPTVLLVDQNGDPVQGATVSFSTSGGATLSSSSFTTGPDGSAPVEWTLGPTPGTYTLEVSGLGISGGDHFLPPTDPADPAFEDPVDLLRGAVTFTAVACEPGFGQPDAIDGVMGSDEWQCAESADFTANLSGGDAPATILWMNDGENLYLAVKVLRSSEDKVNSLRFDFDNGADGIAQAGEDAVLIDADDGFGDEYLTDKCANRTQAGCGEADTSDGGSLDGSGAFGNDGTYTVYELSHPLNGGDALHDLSLSQGDPLGFFLTLQLGNGAQGNTQWPGFRQFKVITIKGSGGP